VNKQTNERTNKQAIQMSKQTKEQTKTNKQATQTNKQTHQQRAVIIQSETNVLYAVASKGACPALEMENYHTYNTIGTISDHCHVPVESLLTLITVNSTVTYIIIPKCLQGLFMQPIFVHVGRVA